ncbi:MAG: hypothetical protein P8N07_02720 [Flavobacteriales bacterium]|nr:hypothetical protein [Flavobacteriales bacterium]
MKLKLHASFILVLFMFGCNINSELNRYLEQTLEYNKKCNSENIDIEISYKDNKKNLSFTIFYSDSLNSNFSIPDSLSIVFLKIVFSEIIIDSNLSTINLSHIYKDHKVNYNYEIDDLYFFKCEEKYSEGKFLNSLFLINKAIKYDPEPIYYETRGFVNYRLNNFSEAINDFRQYSSSDTLINLKVLKHIAICHYRFGNKEELDKIINHLSEVNPTESKKFLEKIKEIEG